MPDPFQQFYSINIVNYVGVEDFADRLSFLYTVSLISICCVLTTSVSYFRQPITCHLPNTFGEFFDGKDIYGQMDYANSYCWTEGAYAVHPMNFSIDVAANDGGLGVYADRKIVYYQWVPFLLALQGIMSYLPRLLWHCISYDRAGTDVGHIVKIASDASREDEETHDKLVTYACRMIEAMLDRTDKGGRESSFSGWDTTQSRFVRAKNSCMRCLNLAMPSRLSGSWLIFTYLIIKAAYLVNAIAQLAIMQNFLQLPSSHYSFLGVTLLRDIISGRDWQNSMAFPRVGCCAVFIRSPVGGNWQFSQCALPVNIINEKVYIFLWFWFVFLTAFTLASICVWLYRLVNATLTSRFVKKYLKLAENYGELRNHKSIIRDFLRQFLRRDGTFVLKMIALNAGDVICAEIIQRLWRNYLNAKGFSKAVEAAAAAESANQPADDCCNRCPKPEKGVLRLTCSHEPIRKRSAYAAPSSVGSAPTTPSSSHSANEVSAASASTSASIHRQRTMRVRYKDTRSSFEDGGGRNDHARADIEALDVTSL